MNKKSNSFINKLLKYIINISMVLELIFLIFLIVLVSRVLGPIYKLQEQVSFLNHQFISTSVVSEKVSYEWVWERPFGWVNLEEISPKLLGAIIVSEDAKFSEHRGVDWQELEVVVDEYLRAMDKDVSGETKKLRGASTISQQLVKNLFLTSEKNVSRKAREILLSLYLESKVPKWKILETYLNIIEYGKNLYGIKNASEFYFNKSPIHLSARESAFLAMLLPSPVRYSVSFKQKKLTEFATDMINSILFKMLQEGYIHQDEYLHQLKIRFDWEIYAEDENTSDDIRDF